MAGFVECPRCGIERDLIEDGDRQDDGEIEWSGCAETTCCGLLIADWWEGTFVYELKAPHITPPESASNVHQYDGSPAGPVTEGATSEPLFSAGEAPGPAGDRPGGGE